MNQYGLDDEDELDLAVDDGSTPMEGGMPNVPRNPDAATDPRQKIKDYLAKQEMRSGLREDPEYRKMARAPMDELRGSDRDIAFSNLLNKSAAQMGTIGGKAAPTAPFDEFSKNLMAQNQGARADILGERQAAQGDEDRQLKIKQYLSDRMQSDEDKAAARAAQANKLKQQKDYQDKMLGYKDRMATAAEGKPGKMGKGQEKLDTLFADEYNQWTSGGREDAATNVNLLKTAKGDLDKAKKDFLTSGNVVGSLPDFFRSEKSLEIQQNVQKAAISALKAALGSQFTEKENLAIQRLSYDPRLSPEANQKKIDRAMEYIEAKIRKVDEKAKFYETHGMSMEGYRDASPGLETLLQDEGPATAKAPGVTAPGAAPPPAGPKAGDVEDGHVFKGGDPADPKNWEAQ